MAKEKEAIKKKVKSKVGTKKTKPVVKSETKVATSKAARPASFSLMNAIAIVIILVIFGGVAYLSSNKSASKNNQTVAAAQTVAYDGEDGKNALELLRNKASDVQTQDTSMGTFVIGINNTIDSDTNFWMFYVNGELAQSTPDQYVTKNGEKIEWRYEAFN